MNKPKNDSNADENGVGEGQNMEEPKVPEVPIDSIMRYLRIFSLYKQGKFEDFNKELLSFVKDILIFVGKDK